MAQRIDSESDEAKKTPRKGVPPKIMKRPAPTVSISTDQADQDREFAFSFAERMKKARREREENAVKESEIKLSRRPTTRAKGTKTQQFPEEDLVQFKKSLLALRDSISGRSGELKKVALEQTDDRGGEDDDGSDSFARLQSLGQVDQQNRVIARIDEALRRIQDGTYGVCEVCGKLIRKPRLLNLPFVHTCMECQNEMESGKRK